MKTEKSRDADRTSCQCSSPEPVVLVGEYYYHAVPLRPDETASCLKCSASYAGPWKLGRAVGLQNPFICGLPKKDGAPCRWRITESACPTHLTPEELERERIRRDEEAERRRVAEEDREAETAERRRNLVGIVSVTCPHCAVPAAELCRNPQGVTVRALHRARRRLAGVDWPKEFVIEAKNSYTPDVEEPPLDGDVRELLGDPLVDRTAEASVRFAAEEQEAAERKLQKAKRELWLASGPRDQAVGEVPCGLCSAPAGKPCAAEGKTLRRPHPQRVDEAMARDDLQAVPV